MNPETTAAVRQHVIDVALKSFQTYGIRQFTMDKLSHELGMSKRTLYQLFSDKEELMMASLDRAEQIRVERLAALQKESENVLDYILSIFRYNLMRYRNQSLSFIVDIMHYPTVEAHMEKHREQSIRESVECMKKGVEQGLFRDDINYELYTKVMSNQLRGLSTNPDFRLLPMKDIFMNITIVYMRGCCTPKGIEIIDKFIKHYADEIIN